MIHTHFLLFLVLGILSMFAGMQRVMKGVISKPSPELALKSMHLLFLTASKIYFSSYELLY